MNMVGLLVRGYWVGTKPLLTLVQRLGIRRSGRRTKGPMMVILTLLAFLLFAYFAAMLTFTYWGYQSLGMMVGKPYLALFLAILVGSIGTAVIAFSSLGTLLYGAPDVRLLATLPIAGCDLAASRLIIIWTLYAPLYAFMTLPAFVIAAWIDGLKVLLALAALVNLLFGPLASLSILLVLLVAGQRIGIGRRFPTLGKIAAMLLFMLFFVGLSALMTRSLDSSGALAHDYQRMIANLVPALDRLIGLFPLSALLARGGFEPLPLLASLLILALCGALATALVVVGYQDVRIGYGCSTSQPKVRHRRRWRIKSPLAALIGREVVIIKSEGLFVFEVVGELLIPLILILVWAITGTLGEMATIAETVVSLPVAAEVIFLILALVASMTMISSTSASRQGRHLAFDRLYPLMARTFVKAKLLFHLAVVGTMNLIYLASALVLVQHSLANLWWMAPLSLATIAALALLQLAIDYHNPHEEWTEARQAMKSNPNGLFGLVVALLFGVVIALCLIVLPIIGVPRAIARLVYAVLLTLILALSYRLAVKSAEGALSR